MKVQWLCLTFLAVAVATVSSEDDLVLAEPCNATLCSLPDCRCSSTTIPGNLTARETPQFVTLTFTGSISQLKMRDYRDLLYVRYNSNRCHISATFFVRHEYTNYAMVNELYNMKFEIALNSISHRFPISFWAKATYEDMVQEIADQKSQLAYFSLIPIDEIKGVRLPYLQNAGNVSFQVMKENRLLYDSTWSTITYQNPGLWPYTLNYASTQDCYVQPCPSASFPGVWVFPLITWRDLQGFSCSLVEDCTFVPRYDDEQRWYKFFMQNFERHYLGTRAPFDVSMTHGFITHNLAIYRALDRFMTYITRLPDAFIVNKRQVIDWSKNPVSLDEFRLQECPSVPSTSYCYVKTCFIESDHNGRLYPMAFCEPIACPTNYPWVGNPYGL